MAIFHWKSDEPLEQAGVKHIAIGSVHLDALRGGAALLVFFSHTRALYFASAFSSYDAVQGTSVSETAVTSTIHSSASGGPKSAISTALGVPYSPSAPVMDELLYSRTKLASEAVVIFFVLSGYLVGGSVLRSVRASRWSWKTYLSKRLTRIYMVLIPALVLGVLLDNAGLRHAGPGSVYNTPAGIPLITTFLLRNRLNAVTIIGNALNLQGILVHYVGTNASIWSLCNEVWYYLTFPFLALGFVKTSRLWLRAAYIAAAAALMWFTGLAVALLFPLWIGGALLVLLPQRLTEAQARMGAMVSAVPFAALIVGVRLLKLNSLSADYVIGLTTCLLLYFLVQRRKSASQGAYKHVATFSSKVSYSLYLYHLPMAVFLCGYVNDPWRPWNASGPHLAVYLATNALIFGCVYSLWRVFEANTDLVRGKLFGSMS